MWLDSPTSESRCVISKALRIHHEPLGAQVSEELPTGLSHCAALDVCLRSTPIFGLWSPSTSAVEWPCDQRLARVHSAVAALLACGRTSD